MKFFMLIMALTINYVSSDRTCAVMNSFIDTNTKCHTSGVVNCNIDNSELLTSNCYNSHYDGVHITSSITSGTKISGEGCTITACVINGGIVSPSSGCEITGCTISAM